MYVVDNIIHLDETSAIKPMKDNDGHWYIIDPADEYLFNTYIKEMEEDGELSINDNYELFTQLNYDISRYTICL